MYTPGEYSLQEFALLRMHYMALCEEVEPLRARDERLCQFAAEVIEATDHDDGHARERVLESVEHLKCWLQEGRG